MTARRPRRAGATRTFSVSVDAETKRALRTLADAEFGGNLSALVTDFAEDARRRLAAAAYLRSHGIPGSRRKKPTILEAEESSATWPQPRGAASLAEPRDSPLRARHGRAHRRRARQAARGSLLPARAHRSSASRRAAARGS